jgi:hypothetical protein
MIKKKVCASVKMYPAGVIVSFLEEIIQNKKKSFIIFYLKKRKKEKRTF